ncbi:hypothetical protein [Morganella morganii IS15]|nr:hypothetical protein CSB69_4178 [Morganella morganii]EMP50185.1 hypothetical protein C790_02588 [Morganella morganii SC01]CDK64483.1 hypothetical protein [Morganella morganii IS15]
MLCHSIPFQSDIVRSVYRANDTLFLTLSPNHKRNHKKKL